MPGANRSIAVATAVAALVAPLLLPATGALADDQEDLRSLRAATATAAGDADARDAAAQAAADRVAAADAAVSHAEAELTSANQRRSSARTLLGQQQAALTAARDNEQAARRRVAAAQARVSATRKAVRSMLRTSFESGLNSELDSISAVAEPNELADRLGLLNHLSGVRHRRLAALTEATDALVVEQRLLTTVTAQAARLVGAAQTQVAIVSTSFRQAATAEAQVQAGRAERVRALGAARKAATAAQERYSTLAAESDHLAAVLRARAAAQAAARAAAARAAATAAAARAAAAQAAAAQAAVRAQAARSSLAPAVPPASPSPAVPPVPSAQQPDAQALPAPASAPGTGGFVMPVQGSFSSGFGPRVDPLTGVQGFHPGQDIAAPTGTPIVAATSGQVAYAGWEQGYGNFTCIDRGDGLATCYGHQSAILVSVGQSVQAGQLIGRVGTTGWSTGPHLHFEVRLDGNPVDPMPYL